MEKIKLIELRTGKGVAMDYQGIAFKLSQELPQTVAVALARLEADQAGEVLKLLPQEMQAEVLLRIAQVKHLPPEILEEIDKLVDSLIRP